MGYLISIRAFPLLLLLLPTLISTLLTQTAFSDDSYLHRICSTRSQIYTRGSPYGTNLNNALTDLINKTPRNKGFGVASSGQNPDRAYGLALCRGDVSSGDCRKCLLNASSQIICPSRKTAIVWRDYCLLKYSDKDFFGQIDTGEKVLMWNTKKGTNPQDFKATAVGLLKDLSENATNNKYMFAGGKSSFGKNNKVTIYGMAQCTRDLSKGNCKGCLDRVMNQLPWDTSPVGGRTLTGSCYVRFEIYPFLNY